MGLSPRAREIRRVRELRSSHRGVRGEVHTGDRVIVAAGPSGPASVDSHVPQRSSRGLDSDFVVDDTQANVSFAGLERDQDIRRGGVVLSVANGVLGYEAESWLGFGML